VSDRRIKKDPHGHPAFIVTIVAACARRAYAQDRQCAREARACLAATDVTTLHDISFFNRIWKRPRRPTDRVREKLQKSSGVLFVTPEYNRSSLGPPRTPSMSARALTARARSSQAGRHHLQLARPLGGVSRPSHLAEHRCGHSVRFLGQPEAYLNASATPSTTRANSSRRRCRRCFSNNLERLPLRRTFQQISGRDGARDAVEGRC